MTLVESSSEVAIAVGPRAVSVGLVLGMPRRIYIGNRQYMPVGLYSLDVARAVAAGVVDDVISYLAGDSPGLPEVQSGEVAELERERLVSEALRCPDDDDVVRWRAMMRAVAAHLRARAVAW